MEPLYNIHRMLRALQPLGQRLLPSHLPTVQEINQFLTVFASEITGDLLKPLLELEAQLGAHRLQFQMSGSSRVVVSVTVDCLSTCHRQLHARHYGIVFCEIPAI